MQNRHSAAAAELQSRDSDDQTGAGELQELHWSILVDWSFAELEFTPAVPDSKAASDSEIGRRGRRARLAGGAPSATGQNTVFKGNAAWHHGDHAATAA